ncbi:MAG: peptidylprolyl isomerase [Ferrovum sp.]|nr:peptidylprolyl isomerase [Ferrovum sp.]NDU86958.1 peptidylprolyl isomerase [Ferrovum sp.]
MKLKQTVLSLALVGGCLGLTLAYAEQTQPAATTSSAPLVVNGATIPAARIKLVTDMQVAQGHNAGPDLDRAVRNNLVALELINDEARKDGVAKDANLQAQIDLMRQQITARAFQAHFIKDHPVSEQTVRADYDRMKSELGDSEYLTEHILVTKEDDAQNIINQLKKGANFEQLAKEKSIDPGSKANGGKLDWASPATYDKNFSDAMVKLKKGETSTTPVKSPFGYHVIRVLDIRPLKAPPFDQMKDRLIQAREQQAFGEYVQQLRSKAKVEGE